MDWSKPVVNGLALTIGSLVEMRFLMQSIKDQEEGKPSHEKEFDFWSLLWE